MKKRWFRWLKIFILIYCSIGILLYYLQDYILFHPQPLDKTHKYDFDVPFREINIAYSSGSNMNIVQFTTDSIPKGVVLYFHGNKMNVSRYAPASENFTKNGYEVWMIDYPGFGKSTGKFSEKLLYDWALTFYKLARANYSPDSIIIYGKSFGTGIASQLASVRDCKYLLMETPYYSLPSVIGSYLPVYPLETIIQYNFPTWEHLQQVTAPVVIFTGTDDMTIPLRNSRQLIPYLKNSDEFIIIEDGGHNNLPEFAEYTVKLDSLLSE